MRLLEDNEVPTAQSRRGEVSKIVAELRATAGRWFEVGVVGPDGLEKKKALSILSALKNKHTYPDILVMQRTLDGALHIYARADAP